MSKPQLTARAVNSKFDAHLLVPVSVLCFRGKNTSVFCYYLCTSAMHRLFKAGNAATNSKHNSFYNQPLISKTSLSFWYKSVISCRHKHFLYNVTKRRKKKKTTKQTKSDNWWYNLDTLNVVIEVDKHECNSTVLFWKHYLITYVITCCMPAHARISPYKLCSVQIYTTTAEVQHIM